MTKVKRMILAVGIWSLGIIPLASAPTIYLYILPFENTQNEADLDWLKQGFVDMLNKTLADQSGLQLKDRNALEEVMNNRSLLLHQPRGSKNLLLLGKYNRKLDQLNVNLQLIDIATWEEVDRRSVSGKYAELPTLYQEITDVLNTMFLPLLPQKKVAAKTYPPLNIPQKKTPPPTYFSESKNVSKSMEKAIDELEKSMDLVIGARALPQRGAVRKEDNEWTMDFNAESKVTDKPENRANTEMLLTVLNQLMANPYEVQMERPQFQYDENNRDQMTVVFPVTYSLKDNLIKDMLTSLPYTGLKEDGSLTFFYFNREKFNFPADLKERISQGRYRAVPVIRFFDEQDQVIVLIADTPETSVYQLESDHVLFLPVHFFAPLIVFSVGGWNLQVSMESVTIPVKYTFTMERERIEKIRRVSLKFVPEDELSTFLQQYL
ncbi:MAG: hypothetical protein ACE5DP_04020 [Fidelibacterota bacterium]